jgi:hypothetical protein
LIIAFNLIATNQRCDEDFLKESLDKAFENKGTQGSPLHVLGTYVNEELIFRAFLTQSFLRSEPHSRVSAKSKLRHA